MNTKPRINLPPTCKIGEIIEIKALIAHVMETGRRVDAATGAIVARRIINRFEATLDGEPVFSAEIEPGIAANPFLSFHLKVPGPGTLTLTWTEDGGAQLSEAVKLPLA